MDFYYFFIFCCIATALFIFIGMWRGNSAASSQTQSSTAKPASSAKQMADDIRMTKTSRVVDEVSILDELSQDMPNFRQYCELVGTSQRTGGVVAPYSRREVAYYEIRCYRIENHGAGDVETLVAHERSFDPFYFVDDSCDTPVYVNLESFGDNVMLVNSTNHIESPNSDFARAVGTSATTTAAAGTSGVKAIVGDIASGVVHGFERVRDAVRPLVPGLVAQPAFAGAGTLSQAAPVGRMLLADGGSGRGALSGSPASARKSMKSNAAGRSSGGSGHGGGAASFSSGGHSGGSRPSSGNQPAQQPQQKGSVTINVGMPTGLGTFLGSGHHFGGYSSVPRPMPRPMVYTTHTYRRTNAGDVISDMITGMVLSSILDSMASSSTTQTTVRPQSTFKGYRLVEDVVPLGSPVYCIGELYHHGTDVYMGRSLATDYPTSYFATKPEVEVLASLGK